MSKKLIASLLASSMLFTPLAEAKFGRSFVRMSPRPTFAKPSTPSAPATPVASKPVPAPVQTSATTTTKTATPSTVTSGATATPVQSITSTSSALSSTTVSKPATTLPTSSIQPVSASSIVPSTGPAAVIPSNTLTTSNAASAVKPVAAPPATLTVASPVYSRRSTTTKVPESSTMQNVAVGVLGGLGIAMLADSLFGDEEGQSSNQAPNATTADTHTSGSSFASLLFTAGLVVVFLGLLWFTVSEYIRYRRRVCQ